MHCPQTDLTLSAIRFSPDKGRAERRLRKENETLNEWRENSIEKIERGKSHTDRMENDTQAAEKNV